MREQSSIELIGHLVSFDTTSSKSNLDLIDFVHGYLTGWGLSPQLIHNEDSTKANLYCTVGPEIDGGIVLSGHTDVVPVTGQDWDTDPFALEERNGKLWGRGTTDMKSFVGCALALVPQLVGQSLTRPIHLAFSYDEEVGCLGVHSLIDHIIEQVARPAVVLVGEPTLMKVVNSHKGLQAYRTTIAGKEAHSSAPQLGANAILAAGRLIAELYELSKRLQQSGDPSGRFEPPHATLNVGEVRGGQAVNIIPAHCTFDWEMRTLPDQDASVLLEEFERFAQEQILPMLQATAPEAAIQTERIAHIRPLQADPGSPAESLGLLLAQQNETLAVSYGTEGGLFQAADIPTIVCGPGDIAQAHQPNEFIDVSQIDACEAFMQRLAQYALQGKTL